MDSNRKIGCCYFPTNVVLIDDKPKFHQGLKLLLNTRQGIYQFYNNPHKALEYLNNSYKPNLFIKNWLLPSEEAKWNSPSVDINISAIYREIYNLNRFNEISVLVVDFAMPGMNGDKLCEQLAGSNFKVILLTGEADEKIATNLFNKGLIHKFIKKDAIGFNKSLKDAIYELQQDYFYTFSLPIISNLISCSEPPCSLNDVEFIHFFNQFCFTHKVVEYYLIDESGSHLLLDFEGNPKWLVVRSEEEMEMEEHYVSMEDTEAPGLLEQIKKREKILFAHNDDELDRPASEWLPYLFPAHQLKTALTTYYYSYIEDPNAFNVQQDKICSYEDYLDQR